MDDRGWIRPGVSLRPGELVEHFTIVGLLGEGGMGQVYVARDTRLERLVALKIVHPAKGVSFESGEGHHHEPA